MSDGSREGGCNIGCMEGSSLDTVNEQDRTRGQQCARCFVSCAQPGRQQAAATVPARDADGGAGVALAASGSVGEADLCSQHLLDLQ